MRKPDRRPRLATGQIDTAHGAIILAVSTASTLTSPTGSPVSDTLRSSVAIVVAPALNTTSAASRPRIRYAAVPPNPWNAGFA